MPARQLDFRNQYEISVELNRVIEGLAADYMQ